MQVELIQLNVNVTEVILKRVLAPFYDYVNNVKSQSQVSEAEDYNYIPA